MSDRKKLLRVLCIVIGELVSESMLRLRLATADAENEFSMTNGGKLSQSPSP